MTRVSEAVILELCDEIKIAPPGSSWAMEAFGRLCLDNQKLAETILMFLPGGVSNLASLMAVLITHEAKVAGGLLGRTSGLVAHVRIRRLRDRRAMVNDRTTDT